MKSFVAICCSLIAAVAANVSVAGPFEREMRFRPFVQAQSPRREPQRDAARPMPRRDLRGNGEADRDAARPVPQRDMRGSGEADRGRMSPDERYQLRRDIQDAGRDIYRRDRQAPGRQQRR